MKQTMFCVLLLLVSATAFCENFAGKWLIESQTPQVGRTQAVLELSQVGDKVAGTLSVVRAENAWAPRMRQSIQGASVKGKTLTFYVWTGRDEPLKDIYKGVLTDKGGLSFEVERAVGPPPLVPADPRGLNGSPPGPPSPAAPSQLTAVPTL